METDTQQVRRCQRPINKNKIENKSPKCHLLPTRSSYTQMEPETFYSDSVSPSLNYTFVMKRLTPEMSFGFDGMIHSVELFCCSGVETRDKMTSLGCSAVACVVNKITRNRQNIWRPRLPNEMAVRTMSGLIRKCNLMTCNIINYNFFLHQCRWNIFWYLNPISSFYFYNKTSRSNTDPCSSFSIFSTKHRFDWWEIITENMWGCFLFAPQKTSPSSM